MNLPSVLGINLGVTQHGKRLRDGGACLLQPGRITAIAEERITRVKHDGGASLAVDYVHAVSRTRNVDVIGGTSCCEELPAENRFASSGAKVVSIDHHVAHAYSAFWPSPFKSAIVIVMDCGGNTVLGAGRDWWKWRRQQSSYYVGDGSSLIPLGDDFSEPYAVGFGELFRATTHFLGWQSSVRAGNTMALAGLGDPPQRRPVYRVSNGRLVSDARLDPDRPIELIRDLLLSQGLKSEPRKTGEPIRDSHISVASYVQESFYQALKWRVLSLIAVTGKRNVCFAGGVALNCVAIGRLLRESIVDAVFVQPAAGDSGQCLGAAYAALHHVGGARADAEAFTPYLGAEYAEEQIDAAMARVRMRDSATLVIEGETSAREAAAKLIASGSLIGMFSGRSEFGPRALGGRSILADPRSIAGRHRVAALKSRAAFLPYAPSILKESCLNYFDGSGSETMTVAVQALAPALANLPGVIHLDGTVRVQSVGTHPTALRKLLEVFYRVTGVPVLLNTSFNLADQPIVETPIDALRVLIRSELDGILFDDRLVLKESMMASEARGDPEHSAVSA